MASKKEILAVIEKQKICFIDLWFTDITGIVKSITVPAHKLESVIDNGLPFDGSSIEGFARVAESDMVLTPDLDTFAILPWELGDCPTARLICSVYTPKGEPFIGDPRNVLIRALEDAHNAGYLFKTGMELEFFLFERDKRERPIVSKTTDQSSYFDMSSDKVQRVRREMLTALDAMGISVHSTHSEIGFGQHEIDLDYTNALQAADQVITTRVVLKAIAQKHGLYCSFMPRPSNDLPGSGMHTHQTLHSAENGENIFADVNHEYGMSEIAQQFLAGQIQHARAMCAVLSPLVNSYKRLGTSFEAPVYVTWAHINRAALIRVPHVVSGMESHTRLELRCPDAATNPYLATTVMLVSGLDGIRHKLPLPEPLEETLLARNRSRRRQVEMLPSSLDDALDLMEQDEVILSALGPYISDRYMAAKRQEFDEYKQQVTQWEVDQYLNRY